jgi:hypothetical protein
MKIITGLFDTRDEAHKAVEALEEAGIPSQDISIIGPQREESTSGTSEGAAVGAAVGGVGGLLAGLAAFAIPGVGPLVGAGWLAATLLGAAAGGVAGGLLGALTDAGIEERDAHVYAESIRRGGTMVTARVEDNMEDPAAAILSRHGRADIAERRRAYEAEGWTAFDETPVADADGRPRVVDPIARAAVLR